MRSSFERTINIKGNELSIFQYFLLWLSNYQNFYKCLFIFEQGGLYESNCIRLFTSSNEDKSRDAPVCAGRL